MRPDGYARAMPYGMRLDDLPDDVNAVATSVLGIALGVHRDLGPGMMESVYEAVLATRLRQAGHDVQVQPLLPVVIDGVRYEKAVRPDLVVDRCVVVEIKAVEALHPRNALQVRTYLRVAGCQVGLLFNFNADLLKNGMERVVVSAPSHHRSIAPSRAPSGSLPPGPGEPPATVTHPTSPPVFEE